MTELTDILKNISIGIGMITLAGLGGYLYERKMTRGMIREEKMAEKSGIKEEDIDYAGAQEVYDRAHRTKLPRQKFYRQSVIRNLLLGKTLTPIQKI